MLSVQRFCTVWDGVKLGKKNILNKRLTYYFILAILVYIRERKTNITTTMKKLTALETARKQLLALGVLESAIKLDGKTMTIPDGVVIHYAGRKSYRDYIHTPKKGVNVEMTPTGVKSSQIRAYEDYKVEQGNKPCKSFEKWLAPQLENLPSMADYIYPIDAVPATILIKEELYCWTLRVVRSERHVQELESALNHEFHGVDGQDSATMVFLKKDVAIRLPGEKKDVFDINNDIRTEKEGYGNRFYIKEESFAPILAKIEAAAAKCGDSFKPIDLRYK